MLIKLFLTFVLAIVLSAGLFIGATRFLKCRVYFAAFASYMLAYGLIWLLGAVWWSLACGAVVGLLYGQHYCQWLDCRPFGGALKPVRWILPAAHVVTIIWIALAYVHMNRVIHHVADTFAAVKAVRAKDFAGRSEAANFVVENYVPCMSATVTIRHGSGKSQRVETLSNSPLSCHAEAIQVANAQNGADFSHEVSLAIAQWEKALAEPSEDLQKALAAVELLAK